MPGKGISHSGGKRTDTNVLLPLASRLQPGAGNETPKEVMRGAVLWIYITIRKMYGWMDGSDILLTGVGALRRGT